MSEDIELLEMDLDDIVNYISKTCIFEYAQIIGEAIKNTINRVKELEQIEAEHQKENGILMEQIKKLEKQNNTYADILATNDMLHALEMEDANKMINLMAEELWCNHYALYMNAYNIKNKDELIEYLRKKVKENEYVL